MALRNTRTRNCKMLQLLAIAAVLAVSASRIALAAPCSTLLADTGFPHCIDLSSNYSVAWQADAEHIWFALDLTTDTPATSWMGFGLSEGGGMKGSDLVVISPQAAGDGSVQVQDLWSEQFALPLVDTSQDVVLVAPLGAGQLADALTPADIAARLTAKPGHLRALLRRKLVTCDFRDLDVTVGLPQPVVWAYGADWPSYHGSSTRGDANINFVPREGEAVVPAAPSTQLPPNTFTMDLVMPNATIPTDETSYLCTHFNLDLPSKHHITAYEGIINSPLVHHIILFACNGPQPATANVKDCLQMEPQCSSYLVGWAPGIGHVGFPDVAGIPIGTGAEGESIPNWFAIQVHYSNPDGVVADAPDTSGIRITVTSDLRTHDMGVLTLTQMNLQLPPGKSRVVAGASLCPSECTSKLTQPINMLYTLLHMHQTGASIITRHIRDGVELPPLGRRRAWDFNYQIMAPVPYESRELRPGDALITQCVFNTNGRDNITYFGQSTLDEMCFNFVTYWPKQQIETCFSNPAARMDGRTVQSAVCAPASIGGGEGGSSMPENMTQEQYLMFLMEKGYVVEASWPSAYTKYSQPQCQVAATQGV